MKKKNFIHLALFLAMITLSCNLCYAQNYEWAISIGGSGFDNATSVVLDEDGNLTEGRGSNVFIVRGGVLTTPKEQSVLAGITRQLVLDLASSLRMPVEEKDIDLYDAYTDEEAFLTSTSLCICPVSSINGTVLSDGNVPGPVTAKLTSAFCDVVGMDYVAQYLAHL